MKRKLAILLACLVPLGWADTREGGVEIKITIGKGTVLTATLENNEAARGFAAMLPLELVLEDYNATEKIADLPKRLSRHGAPAALDPEPGDIAYYAPWGNLAVFYCDFGPSPGLIRLARVDSGVEAFAVAGPVKARVEILR